MKVLQINSVPYGSTGHMMFSIADRLHEQKIEVLCSGGFAWKTSVRKDFYLISNFLEKSFHMFAARVTGYNGCFSVFSTWKFIRKIEKYSPDVIHLHNLHGWYLNLPRFFRYLKKHPEIKVIWTLHDCWTVTGQCPHFIGTGCDKWKIGCGDCAEHHAYPKTYVDKSKVMYELKKKWFNGVSNMTIVTPSKWLKTVIEESFLNSYEVKVIHNGINLSVFKPEKSDFRKKYQLEEKYVLLGVSYAWDAKKGLDVFIRLAERLPETYRIVLVGVDEKVKRQLPEKIIGISRTQNQKELAEIYTAADLFVNPTKEDNYPTVHMESLACGTPVITYDTGGAGEMIGPGCGTVIPYNDVTEMEKEIRFRCEVQRFCQEDCLKKALEFDEKERYQEYLDLYESVE